MRPLRVSAYFLAFALALPVSAGSEIYKYTDANGTVRFTTNLDAVPPAQRAAAQAASQARAKANAPVASPAAIAEPAPAAKGSGKVRASSHTPETMMLLRSRLLHGKANTYGIDPKLPVWGVLMEEYVGGGAYTLIALANGSSSIYFSNGGGVVGGERVPAINAAARAMTERGAKDLVGGCAVDDSRLCAHIGSQFVPTDKFPLMQGRGRVQFFLLTPRGVHTAATERGALAETRGPLAPLFFAGHAVMTGLREASEAQGLH